MWTETRFAGAEYVELCEFERFKFGRRSVGDPLITLATDSARGPIIADPVRLRCSECFLRGELSDLLNKRALILN